jgi:hypothetical protein
MSFLHHIAVCNKHDLSNFLPFVVAGEQVGWVKHGFAARLKEYTDAFSVSGDRVSLAPGLDNYDDRTRAVDSVLRKFVVQGLIWGWRGEYYPVGTSFAGPHLMEMERAAIPFFGIRAYGIHVNGFVRDGADIHMWIARRSGGKQTFPNELDNMIAGGQPVGISLQENVIKEAWEEAAVPADLAARAHPVSEVSYCQETEHFLRPDTLFNYDLELPAEFVPNNTDGEVAEFFLWPMDKVMEVVENTDDIKFNCNLVIIDFCIRHGLIEPEQPDYQALAQGLRTVL